MGTIVPLQIKLISQLLMVSTRNTSRSNANPPRIQDQPGDVVSRPPGALETMQANTKEVEALRLTNQCLIGELEQLTKKMQCPREARQTREGHNITRHEGQQNLSTPRGAETEAESSRAKRQGPHLTLERRVTTQHLGGTSGTRNYDPHNKGWGSDHGNRSSRTSSGNSVA